MDESGRPTARERAGRRGTTLLRDIPEDERSGHPLAEGTSLLTLDGSHGEGGGQILRTALSLAAALGCPVTVTGVRAGRRRPGLQPQHLAVVRALGAIADAEVRGAALGSTHVTFAPRGLRGGDYRIDVGAERASAGSVTLLFQAMLLPLARAATPSLVTLVGGTHVPWSPPVHYLTEVFLPAAHALGLAATVRLARWGWYPAGGGEIEASIAPARVAAVRLDTPPRGPIAGVSAVSRLPRSIAERQSRRALERLAAAGVEARIPVEVDATSRSPGTLVFLAARGRAGFTALGRRGVAAERVADDAVDALLAFRASGTAVDDHLADQLVPFLALAGEPSEWTCPTLSSHLRTVAWVVEAFGLARVQLAEGPPGRVRIEPPR